MQITEHFNSETDRMNCRCGCDKLIYDSQFMHKVQTLRYLIDKPFNVRSFYRCPDHNKAIGGALHSRHMFGSAIDICTLGFSYEDQWEIIHEAMKLGLSVITNKSKKYIHLDSRDGKPIFIPG